jgi:hypothetical protein
MRTRHATPRRAQRTQRLILGHGKTLPTFNATLLRLLRFRIGTNREGRSRAHLCWDAGKGRAITHSKGAYA